LWRRPRPKLGCGAKERRRRRRRRWEDNIRKEPTEMEWEDVDWPSRESSVV
jgi:hypothetical protein